jgi:hypothetical protein
MFCRDDWQVYTSNKQEPDLGTDDATLLVRGRSSYTANQEPLILADGVERFYQHGLE